MSRLAHLLLFIVLATLSALSTLAVHSFISSKSQASVPLSKSSDATATINLDLPPNPVALEKTHFFLRFRESFAMAAAIGILILATICVGMLLYYFYFMKAAEPSLPLSEIIVEQQKKRVQAEPELSKHHGKPVADDDDDECNKDEAGLSLKIIVAMVLILGSLLISVLWLLAWKFGWLGADDHVAVSPDQPLQNDQIELEKDKPSMTFDGKPRPTRNNPINLSDDDRNLVYDVEFNIIARMALKEEDLEISLDSLVCEYKSAMNIGLSEPINFSGIMQVLELNSAAYHTILLRKKCLLLHVCATLCRRLGKLVIVIIKGEGKFITDTKSLSESEAHAYYLVDFEDFLAKKEYEVIRTKWLANVMSSQFYMCYDPDIVFFYT